MKKIFLLTLLCACAAKTFAQALPEFGTAPDMADMRMKEYDKDKSAPAMVLAENGKLMFDVDLATNSILTQRLERRRVKVFTDKGLGYANVKITYISNNKYEEIKDITGYVYNLDENGTIVTTKLLPENIIRQQEGENTSSINFSLPNVKPGSVFEYQYTGVKKSVTRIDPWVLQHHIPTRISRFVFESLPNVRYSTKFVTWPQYNLEQKEEEGALKIISNGARIHPQVFTYTLRNVEPFKTEPYMTGPGNYIQRLEFDLLGTQGSESGSWQQIARRLDDDFYFGDQLKKKVVIPELEDGIAKMNGNWEKIKYIHKYVRTHFTWNGTSDFLSLNVKKINREKKGTTGDINLMLINLLQSHGIETYPLLCSTSDNPPVSQFLPNVNQFNTLNAIVREGGKWYILNGADKYNPTHLVPYDLMNTQALKLNGEEEPQWIDIWEPGMIEKQNAAYMINIAQDGEANGNAYITSSGYARAPRIKTLEEGKEKYGQLYFSGNLPGMTIEDLSVKNEDDDEADLIQQFKFNMKLNSSGDYLYFNTNMFTGLENNPFIAEKRISDVDFSFNRRILLTARIVLPENLQAEELPKSLRIIMPDTSITFTRNYTQEDNVIMLKQELEFNRPIFSAAEYPDFRLFYKKLYDMLNEQIVFKKKN